MRRLALLGLGLVVAACPPPRVPAPAVESAADVDAALAAAEAAWARRPDEAQVREALRAYQSAAARLEGLTGAVKTAAWLIEHGAKADRKELVESALDAAGQCQQRAPAEPLCDYWQAAALGIAARERPLSALGNLSELVSLLQRAAAKQPALDQGGPSRLLAIVLVKAPGWPTGPGNPDEGVVAAQQAVAIAPAYPPNHLALADALAATGDADGAKAAYAKAAELAKAGVGPDASEWTAQAAAGLERL